MVSSTTRRKTCKNVPTNKHASQVGDHTTEDNTEVVCERPPCRKSDKDKERKRKSRKPKLIEFVTYLARMVKDINLYIVERRVTIMNTERDRKE